jgi:hypothetical protein
MTKARGKAYQKPLFSRTVAWSFDGVCHGMVTMSAAQQKQVEDMRIEGLTIEQVYRMFDAMMKAVKDPAPVPA